MPTNDDFAAFDGADDSAPAPAPAPAPATPLPTDGNRTARRKKKGRAAVPANAPEPQDHLTKQAVRAAEASNGSTIVLTLWGEEIRVEQSELFDSWDWQVGAIQKNALMMVKGLLGDARFLWFATRAQADGKTPAEAAGEVMQLFSQATGIGSTGK